MPSAGAGPIVGAHRLLIATAVACGAIFTLFSGRAFFLSGEVSAALVTLAALAVTIGMLAYLRSLRSLAAKLTPRDSR